jgi:methylglyoxal synthase
LWGDVEVEARVRCLWLQVIARLPAARTRVPPPSLIAIHAFPGYILPDHRQRARLTPTDTMEKIKNIALVAHDNRKHDLVEWVRWNRDILAQHRLVCTGTTGRLVEEGLRSENRKGADAPLQITKLKSGPLGGDQQLGAMIAEGKIDVMIFLWDPMEPQPHDVDVRALLRIAVVYNIPTANNRSTADFLVSSPLLGEPYQPAVVDYSAYVQRSLPG